MRGRLQHHHKSYLLWTTALLLTTASVFSIWGTYQLVTAPKVVAAGVPNSAGPTVDLRSVLRIQFDKPIDHNQLVPKIEPSVEGSWKFEDALFGEQFYQAVSFTPATHFAPDQDYHITLEKISPVLGSNEANFEYSFKTKPIPTVQSISLADGKSVGICESFTFALNTTNPKLAEFIPKLDPPIDLQTDLSEDQQSYTVKPRRCLDQGRTYQLSIDRSLTIYDTGDKLLVREEPKEVMATTFETKAAPSVTSFAPSGEDILTSVKEIKVTFSEPMSKGDVEQAIQIKPALNGTWKWLDDTTIVYVTSQSLQFDTTYTVTLPQGTQDLKQGYFPEETNLTFTTIGHADIASFTPRNGSREVSSGTSISVQFDQDVDHSSAEAAFSMSPSVPGSFSWQGRKMTFKPQGLAKDTSYTATINKGVKSIHGLETLRTVSTSFTTEQSVTLLNVPLDLQDYPLSCEIASLKMALTYRGIRVSENDIINQIGYDTTPHNGSIWGDPDVAFVGSITGRQNSTGYGVHWAPIARVANNYRSSSAFSGWGAKRLAEEISKGNPVIIWGIQGRPSYTPWQTPSGKTIPAWVGEHARVVIGFKGSADNPQYFIINDPIAGRITWTTSQLLNNWSTYHNSGVAVY